MRLYKPLSIADQIVTIFTDANRTGINKEHRAFDIEMMLAAADVTSLYAGLAGLLATFLSVRTIKQRRKMIFTKQGDEQLLDAHAKVWQPSQPVVLSQRFEFPF